MDDEITSGGQKRSSSSSHLDFVTYWADQTVEQEILRGHYLRQEKSRSYPPLQENDVVTIDFIKPPRITKNCGSGRKVNVTRCFTKSHSRSNSPSPPRVKRSKKAKTLKKKSPCGMRIAELAVPTKRQCMETWRSKYNILPPDMVERLRQHVMDQRPVVQIADAMYCFKRRRCIKSGKSDRRVDSFERSNKKPKKPLKKSEVTTLSAIFGHKIAKKLNTPMQIVLNSDLQKIANVISFDIADIICKSKAIDTRSKISQSIHIDVTKKVTVWVSDILEESSYKILEEIEEELGPVFDLIDDLVDNVVDICEPEAEVIEEPFSSESHKGSEKSLILGDEKDSIHLELNTEDELNNALNTIIDTLSTTEDFFMKEDVYLDGENKAETDQSDFVDAKDGLEDFIDDSDMEEGLDHDGENFLDENRSKQIKTEDIQAKEIIVEEINAEETIGEEIDTEEINAEDIKAEETIVEDFNIKEPIAEDISIKETITEEFNFEEMNGEYTKAEKTIFEYTNAGGTIAEDLNTGEINLDDIKAEEIIVDDTNAEEPITGDFNAKETKLEDNKTEETISEYFNAEEINTEDIKGQEPIDENINGEPNAEELNANEIRINVEDIKVEKITIEDINTEETNTYGMNTEQVDSEEVKSEDTNIEEDSNRKVKFNEEGVNVDTEKSNEINDAGEVSGKPSIAYIEFAAPNEDLLSDADESWLDVIQPPILRPSESAIKSISSLGNIVEDEEKSRTDVLEETTDNETAIDDDNKLETTSDQDKPELNDTAPTPEKSKTTKEMTKPEYKKAPMNDIIRDEKVKSEPNVRKISKPKARVSANSQRRSTITEKKFSKDLGKKREPIPIKPDKGPYKMTPEKNIHKNIKDKRKERPFKNIYKGGKGTKQSAKDLAESDSKEKAKVEKNISLRVKPKPSYRVDAITAPSWVSKTLGESSCTCVDMALQPKFTSKINKIEIRKWCSDLENALKNLKTWNNWLNNTTRTMNIQHEMGGFDCPGACGNSYIKQLIRFKRNMDSDALLFKRIKQNTQQQLRTYRKIYHKK